MDPVGTTETGKKADKVVKPFEGFKEFPDALLLKVVPLKLHSTHLLLTQLFLVFFLSSWAWSVPIQLSFSVL